MPTTAFAESLHIKSGGAIPSESATPEEVRMYISELLIDDYYTPPNEAKQHAAKWEIGRCSQLFLNNEETQRRIFGENVGVCIHRALQMRMKALWEREPTVVYSKYAVIGSGALLAAVTVILIFALDLNRASDLRILGRSSILWLLNGVCGVYYTFKHPFDQAKGAIVCGISAITFLIGMILLIPAFVA